MADRTRSVEVLLSAKVTGFVAGMEQARLSANRFVQDSSLAMGRNRAAIDTVSNSVGKMTVVTAAGLGLAIKSAIDWESAWAGVTKTTSGTAKQMAELEHQLREMAKSMPATHEEIAATAEAAGQLGVAREDIAEFTKVMVMLGETTNLTADEAATSMAQFMNIMGTAPDKVGNLGSALVALGNNGASTERDILNMAANIAGAGKIVGLTEGEILALANALSSVGIEAEAGGSSVSRVLMDMSKAAKTGSSDMALWASTAEKGGLSTEKFAQTMQDSPARAFDAFVKGLGQINKEGGDVFGLLDDLGQSDIRVVRALLNLAGAGDLLSDSLDRQGREIGKTQALLREFAKRNETTGAEVQKSWNSIKDSLIDIGAAALPAVETLAESVTKIADAFGDLPDPVQSAIVKVLAMTTALGGTVWVGTKVVSSVSALSEALGVLSRNSDGVSRSQLFVRGGAAFAGMGLATVSSDAHEASDALGFLTDVAAATALGFSVGGPWGAAIGGGIGALGTIAKSAVDAGKAQGALAGQIDAVSTTLDGQTRAVTRATEAWARNQLVKSGAVSAAAKLGISQEDLIPAGTGDADARRRVLAQGRAAVSAASQDLLAPGNTLADARKLDELSSAYKILTNAIGSTNATIKEAQTQSRQSAELAYKQAGAFGEVAKALGTAFGGATKYVEALDAVPPEVRTEVVENGSRSSLEAVTALADAYGKTPSEVMTELIANDLATGKLQIVDGQLVDLNGKVVEAVVDADIDAAKQKAAEAKAKLDAVAKAKYRATIDADPGPAISAAKSAQRAIESAISAAKRLASRGGGGGGGGGGSWADGGIVSYYASGTENHVAQIAAAGDWRVWAEPETGGEAYIPLAASKRDRSIDIWEETGKRLGVFDQGTPVYQADDQTFAREFTSSQVLALSPRASDGGTPTVLVSDFKIDDWNEGIGHLTLKVGAEMAGSINYVTIGGI